MAPPIAAAVLALLGPIGPGPWAAPQRLQPASARPREREESDPRLEAVRSWAARVRGRASLAAEDPAAVERLVADLLLAGARSKEPDPAVLTALVDVVAACLAAEEPAPKWSETSEMEPSTRARLLDLARESWTAFLDGPRADWIGREVLSVPSGNPLERRVAAAWLLARSRRAEALPALLIAVRGDEPVLVETVLRGLSGWDHEAVNAVFAEPLPGRGAPSAEIDDARLRAVQLAQAEVHFASIEIAPGSPPEARLAELVRRDLIATDWRTASRAVSMAHALADPTAIPICLEAMSAWAERQESGRACLRILSEIARDLERRSGRHYGVRPERWKAWWRAVQEGRMPLDASSDPAGDTATWATFFGLRPCSDRVVFVVDRSGSMAEAFGPRTHAPGSDVPSRYDEAVAQLVRFLEVAGPTCRFGVVLFSSRTEQWRSALVPATEGRRDEIREWLLRHRPDGGTALRDGIERALMVQNGRIDLARLEADTAVVLCDGATDEGPGWVVPFQEQANAEARIVFDCVQIGADGDGTLEALARLTGGDWVRVDG